MPTREIPIWAYNHLHAHLPAHNPITNATLARRGVVVANTRLGAVVVMKSPLGEPRHVFLEAPNRRLAFECSACSEKLEFHQIEVPRTVFCGLCGARYRVGAEGDVQAVGGPLLPPTAAAAPAPPARNGHAKAEAVAAAPGAPFRFGDYALYTRQVTLRGGNGTRPIYFFAKSRPASGHPTAKPEGFHVGVNQRTGLPFLKRGAAPDGEDVTPAAPAPALRPQCKAVGHGGRQCRNSARHGSDYCGSHKGYQPATARTVRANAPARGAVDTRPRVTGAKDTAPALRHVTPPAA